MNAYVNASDSSSVTSESFTVSWLVYGWAKLSFSLSYHIIIGLSNSVFSA